MQFLRQLIVISAALGLALAGGITTTAQGDRRPAPPGGQEPPPLERRLALVIGNDAYPGVRLVNAVADARAVGASLRALGFEVAEITDADLPAMERALAEFAARLRGTDVAVVYYAGHGMQIESENFLLPVDLPLAGSDAVDVKYRAYPASKVLDRLTPARVRILVLDACRDTPYGGTRSSARGLSGMQAQGALIAYAAGPGETASDNPGGANGLFTTHLLELLQEPDLSVTELFRRVRQRVNQASDGRQTPWLADGLIGDYFLNTDPARSATLSLTVRTEPVGARLVVDGRVLGTASPELIVAGLAPGPHTFVAQHEGFAEAHVTVAVESGMPPITIRLAPEAGALRVTADPQGAEVRVNGMDRGSTPIEVRGLAPGSHRVEVFRAGYVPYAGEVEVRGGATAPVAVVLTPLGARGATEETGILVVSSTPEGAQVYVDGTPVGTTPLTLESVTPGARAISVSRPFFDAADLQETIRSRIVSRVDVRLTPTPATLEIATDFEQGTLWLDDVEVGVLPTATAAIETTAGEHTVVLQHPVIGDISRTVVVQPPLTRVNVRAVDTVGSLTLLSDLPFDSLRVDGRSVERLPATVESLRAGEVDAIGTIGSRVLAWTLRVLPGEVTVERLTEGASHEPLPGTARPGPDVPGVRWAYIPDGTFWMGCAAGDRGCAADEGPRIQVTISRPFELMTTEATRAMWRAARLVLPAQPAWTPDETHPVVMVSWHQAVEFCEAAGGRLPTEAEWEYAARGGLSGALYPWGNDVPVATLAASNGARFGSIAAVPVRRYRPNKFGLHDMAGNVWEWVSDWHGRYGADAITDPRGRSSGTLRVARGGSWNSSDLGYLRVSSRNYFTPVSQLPFVGVRCARDILR